MCLAVAGIIRRIEEGEAIVDYDGVTRRAELTLVPAARVGDRALVHAGFVIALLEEREGDERMRLEREASFRG